MADRPNIVMITADELKASAVSAYGNPYAFTPNIDQLGAEGFQFQRAFTPFPKCVPARSAILTGRYPHVGGHRTLPGFELQAEEPNFPAWLKKQGYKMAMIGKNHWMESSLRDELFTLTSQKSLGIQPRKERTEEDDPLLYRAMYRPETYEAAELNDTFETDLACQFIQEHANKEDPFFLLMDISMPHPVYVNVHPFIDRVRAQNIPLPKIEPLAQAPAVLRAYRQEYDLESMQEQDWRQVVEAYYSMVSYADHCLGRVMQALAEAGQADDTIVIFTSDHGDFAGEHGCVEKWDAMFYDCLVHVPLMVRYPRRISKGMKSEALVSLVDLVPTLQELLDEPVPGWVQGESFLPVMDGEREAHHPYVYCEGGVEEAALATARDYNDEFYERLPNYQTKQKVLYNQPFTLQRSKMIRNEEWKLVYRVDGTMELYNLGHDPAEHHDVSGKEENKEVIFQLMQELLKWCIRTETNLPQITDMRA